MMWIFWAQLLPEQSPARLLLKMESTWYRNLFNGILLYTLAVINIKDIPLKFVIIIRSPFLGWAAGSSFSGWNMETKHFRSKILDYVHHNVIRSSSYWSASAVICRLAGLFSLIWRIVKRASLLACRWISLYRKILSRVWQIRWRFTIAVVEKGPYVFHPFSE